MAEVHHGMDTKTLQARLPLLWFDRLLRRHGPLLPLPVFAIRLAVDIASVLSHGHNLQSPQGNRLRHHLAEAAVVYAGVTAVRLFVYGLHCAGAYFSQLRYPHSFKHDNQRLVRECHAAKGICEQVKRSAEDWIVYR